MNSGQNTCMWHVFCFVLLIKYFRLLPRLDDFRLKKRYNLQYSVYMNIFMMLLDACTKLHY